MVKRTVIGNKPQIIENKQELSELESFILNLSGKTKAELDVWFESKFSSLPVDVKDGLYTVVKAVWALSKVLKKIWSFVKFFRK